MSFRDQQEHDLERKRVQERLLKQERQRAAEERSIRRTERWKSFKSKAKNTLTASGIMLILVAICGVLAWGFSRVTAFVSQAEQDAQVQAVNDHQALLSHLRQHLPEGVEQDTWLWCVDHCARFGVHNEDRYAEGIVTDTFLDYRQDPPKELITVYGPWLDAEQQIRVSYEVQLEELDPPSTHFEVGDLIRISSISAAPAAGRIYTFRRFHRED